ncbi:MAG: FAD:protein FMN transferase [Candidatus Neomarinimicrobiota bacterium]
MISLVKQNKNLIIKKAQLWLGFFTLIISLYGCKTKDQIITINGNTMGTSYSIKIVNKLPKHIDKNIAKIKIDSVLRVVNQQMSTYITESEISRFNRLISKDWFTVSSEFHDVIVAAHQISNLTEGAFDITVGSIIDLWGFGKATRQNNWQPPTDDDIRKIKKSIGFNNISVGDNSIKKNNLESKIDLNAIAKGYGVDAVFELLRDFGYTDILVEIGGEVRCTGYNDEGNHWKIGINKPILNITPGTEYQTVISLDNAALATSGDYQNYFEYKGNLYSHTIDPVTGYPTQNHVASASVTAPNCMTADALATALMVMGKEGISLINLLDNTEAMIIIRTDEEKDDIVESIGWARN